MTEESAKLPNNGHFLKEPLQLGALLGEGTTFEVNTHFDEHLVDDIFDELNLDSSDDDDDGADETGDASDKKKRLNIKSLVSPWTKPFAELRDEMTCVNEHIYKKIITFGDESSEQLPTNARVSLRYTAFWEGESAPFDSTYLRGSAFSFYTGRSEVLPGLEQAVYTMKRNEKSYFLISYPLLFRELGCPPRIKPRADGLFVIELVHFNAVGNLDADLQLEEEERSKYNLVLPLAKEVYTKGLDFFAQASHRNASAAFKKAVNMLTYCRLANEAENKERDEFLLKLLINMMVCYNKENVPRETCLIAKQIRELTNNKQPCKALYHEAKALHMLGEYDRARTLLIRAQNMQPHNKDISKELEKVQQSMATFKKNEKDIWTRACGMWKTTSAATATAVAGAAIDGNENGEFDYLTDLLKKFKASKERALVLPAGFSDKEIAVIEKLAQTFDMRFEVSSTPDKIYKVRKQ